VCQGFKAPDTIDPKFLDPKFAFEDVDDDQDSSNKITSLKKLLDTKKNRSGYSTDRGILYSETDFYEFLEC
jgi:AdoMet-dependent rRNA methyltransferase SPB1